MKRVLIGLVLLLLASGFVSAQRGQQPVPPSAPQGAALSAPKPGDPVYEEQQAKLKEVAEARRQREETRARQKAEEDARRAEAARLKAEREAEETRKAAEEAARVAAEEAAIVASAAT